MPSIKKSVMLSEQTQNYISSRQRSEDGDYSWSQGVNGAVHALTWMLDQALPELTQYEWECVLNTFNGTMFDDMRMQSFLSLSSRMMDERGALSLEDVEPEYAAVIRRVHQLSLIEQYAVADTARKFWAKSFGKIEEGMTLIDLINLRRGV